MRLQTDRIKRRVPRSRHRRDRENRSLRAITLRAQASSSYSERGVRRRLEPLRVRPFDRLLTSYTVNDLGDSIGVVALAVLVFDRTHDVAPTAGFFLVAKFLPALVATGLTARLDQLPLRRTLPVI